MFQAATDERVPGRRLTFERGEGMRSIGGWRATLFGVGAGLAAVTLAGFFVSPAGAHETGEFKDKNYQVSGQPSDRKSVV
jgi:hypothetical protein